MDYIPGVDGIAGLIRALMTGNLTYLCDSNLKADAIKALTPNFKPAEQTTQTFITAVNNWMIGELVGKAKGELDDSISGRIEDNLTKLLKPTSDPKETVKILDQKDGNALKNADTPEKQCTLIQKIIDRNDKDKDTWGLPSFKDCKGYFEKYTCEIDTSSGASLNKYKGEEDAKKCRRGIAGLKDCKETKYAALTKQGKGEVYAERDSHNFCAPVIAEQYDALLSFKGKKCTDVGKAGSTNFKDIAPLGFNFLKQLVSCSTKFAAAALTSLVAHTGLVIVSHIVNLFSFAILSMIRLAYYIIKALYYLIKGLNEDAEEAKAGLFGSALGCGIKVILIILHVGKKRRMKKMMRNAKRKNYRRNK